MPRYENDWGDEFENEEKARQDAWEHMEYSDYTEKLGYSISHGALLQWAMRQDRFWIHFNEEIHEAEDSYFRENYHEITERECEEED